MNFLIIGEISKRMYEGGPVFMYPILILFFVCLGLGIWAFLKGDEDGKKKELLSHVSLFTMVWGFFGMMIGLIEAFDAISAAISISSAVIAGGLKIGLLAPLFGMFVFLIARLLLIVLLIKDKPLRE
ncbi:MotA/TolQ/ExbB proton channel family protein [Tenacibaculum amylolyticum]|uniref:MotA/TolQ/ExbB proton channel family protein n=1 Tax=Tenacibaculum amylolyticum TaxID=104269 RepID=UPI003892DA5E